MSRSKIIIGTLVALILIFFLGIPWGIKYAVRYAALQELSVFGIKDINISQVSLSWGSVSIRDIRVQTARGYQPKGREDYLIIDQVEGKFTPLHLLTRGFNELFVRGVSLWIEPQSGYLSSFNELDKPLFRLNHTSKQAPNITIENSEIIIVDDEKKLHIPVTATVTSEPGKPRVIKAQWTLTGDSSAEGYLNFENDEQDHFEMNLIGNKILLNPDTIGVTADDLQLTAKGTAGSDIYDLALAFTINDVSIGKVSTFRSPLHFDATATGPLTQLNLKASLKEKNKKEADKGKKTKETMPFINVFGTIAPFKAIASTEWNIDIPRVQDFINLAKFSELSEDFPQSLSGQIKIDGTVKWTKSWSTPDKVEATISLQDIDTIYHDLQGTGISGSVKITGLFPFATKNHQVLSAKSIKVKTFDMQDIKLEFYASALGGISVNNFSGALFDGTISAHSFRKNIKDPEGSLTFDTNFRDIQLNDVLKISDIKGLSGTGKLTGTASFKMSDRGIELTRAQFRSSSAQGSLVYIPPAPPSEKSTAPSDKTKTASNFEGADIALEVLKNLQYTLLDVTVASASNTGTTLSREPSEAQQPENLQANVKILGYNPKVLNGYPFEFNIATTGKLGDLVLNTLNNIKPPKDLQELSATIKKSRS